MNSFANRRKELAKQMGPYSMAIIPSAPEYFRNGDTHYPYRQNSDFYYLTGFIEPESIAVILTGQRSHEYILFNRPRDATMELWTGVRAGQEGAVKQFHADRSFNIEDFNTQFVELAEKVERIYVSFANPKFLTRINKLWQKIRAKIRSGVNFPQTFLDLDALIHEMRLIKSADEIAIMKQAAKITVEAHKRAMRFCKPGIYEYQLEAELLQEFVQQGARELAYPSIVGAGNNACVLHYTANNCKVAEKDLVLIDAGCEYQLYASDVTRTFPANGRFTPEQKALYEIVLKANEKAIQAVKPGLAWNELQTITDLVVTEGLMELRLLKGNLNELMKKQACRVFYPHRSGHWLGLDVHDVGRYKVKDDWRKLKAGMAFTIEPGIYISAEADVPEKWRKIGIRIEDDIVVTSKGAEVLSKDLPKKTDDIENLMK